MHSPQVRQAISAREHHHRDHMHLCTHLDDRRTTHRQPPGHTTRHRPHRAFPCQCTPVPGTPFSRRETNPRVPVRMTLTVQAVPATNGTPGRGRATSSAAMMHSTTGALHTTTEHSSTRNSWRITLPGEEGVHRDDKAAQDRQRQASQRKETQIWTPPQSRPY